MSLNLATSASQSKQEHIVKVGTRIEASIFEKYSSERLIASYIGGRNMSNSIYFIELPVENIGLHS